MHLVMQRDNVSWQYSDNLSKYDPFFCKRNIAPCSNLVPDYEKLGFKKDVLIIL